MRLINIGDAQPGMMLAREIVDRDGSTLLRERVVLTKAYIRTLRMKGYTRFFIREEDDAIAVAGEHDVSLAVRAMAIETLQTAYESIEEEVGSLRVQSAREIEIALDAKGVQDLVSEDGPLAEIGSVVDRILDEVLSRRTLAGLTSIKSASSSVLNHSIDVCAVSVMIGHLIDLPKSRIEPLAMGALLHDIGVIFLDTQVIGDQRIIQHTQLGYELLRQSDQANALAPHAAYEHHECPDGTGLPRGLRGSNTIRRDRALPPPVPTLIGEIVAVANVYDNLLTGTDAHEPMATDEALRTIKTMAGSKLNREIVQTLMRAVPVFPLGTEVVIRNGPLRSYTAVVTRVHRDALDRPVITLTHDMQRRRVPPEEIDLSQSEDIEIRGKGLDA